MKTRSTYAILAAALAAGLMPPPVTAPSAWAAENIIVAEGPAAGQRWDPALTPYAPEILDCLDPDHPCNTVTVKKSAQVGLTLLGIAWIGYIADQAPSNAMVVFPTINGVKDYNRGKLQPTIDASPCLRGRIVEHTSRSARGSTALTKRFAGGSVVLTGANSSTDLRSKTIRFVDCEEIDEWPLDLAGQGDPMRMVDARQLAFHAKGGWKKLLQSTPTLRHISRIDRAFEEGDQRFWYVACPQCAEEQRLIFGGKDHKHGLKFNTRRPVEAHYVCVNGCIVEHHQKPAMVRGGRWVAEAPDPGRQPSFHIDALVSLLTTWDRIAEEFLRAKDDPEALKAFVNLWLGESFEERGDAPDWRILLLRRAPYSLRTIPNGGLVLTAAADVQQDGIYYETVAWAQDDQSWSIDYGYFEGRTADPDDKVWRLLASVYEREYEDAHGRAWRIDAFGVDAGYQSHVVYDWTRQRPKAMALKGDPGWYRAPISAAPSRVDVSLRGKRISRGAKLWRVGAWPLASTLTANLRKEGMRAGKDENPPGYCHFSNEHEEAFFRHLVAEVLKDTETRGRMVKRWTQTGPNHWRDCRIYNMALMRHLTAKLTPDDWDRIAASRGAPEVAKPKSALTAAQRLAQLNG